MVTAQSISKEISYGIDDDLAAFGGIYWVAVEVDGFKKAVKHFQSADEQLDFCTRVAKLIAWVEASYGRMMDELDRHLRLAAYAINGTFGSPGAGVRACREAVWAGQQLKTEATTYWMARDYLTRALGS